MKVKAALALFFHTFVFQKMAAHAALAVHLEFCAHDIILQHFKIKLCQFAKKTSRVYTILQNGIVYTIFQNKMNRHV
jgi:hypothetical protein